MEPQAECILVLIGATPEGKPEGKKELLGLQVGLRERPELAGTAGRPQGSRPDHRAGTGYRRRLPWLVEGVRGGVADDPASALHRAQTANALDKLPKSVQPAAKADLREIWAAPDCAAAEAAIATFAEKYGAKYSRSMLSISRMTLPGRDGTLLSSAVRFYSSCSRSGCQRSLIGVNEGLPDTERVHSVRCGSGSDTGGVGNESSHQRPVDVGRQRCGAPGHRPEHWKDARVPRGRDGGRY